MYAVRRGQVQTVKLLLDRGASLDARNGVIMISNAIHMYISEIMFCSFNCAFLSLLMKFEGVLPQQYVTCCFHIPHMLRCVHFHIHCSGWLERSLVGCSLRSCRDSEDAPRKRSQDRVDR